MRCSTYKSVAVLLMLALFSCSKKDSTPDNTTQTPKETLMASQWKKSEYRENGTVMPFFGSCEMDDVFSFNQTSWVLDDGTNKCSSSVPGSTDLYFIDADNKTMRWAYGTGELSFNSSKTAFTFKRTGANTFEYVFVKK